MEGAGSHVVATASSGTGRRTAVCHLSCGRGLLGWPPLRAPLENAEGGRARAREREAGTQRPACSLPPLQPPSTYLSHGLSPAIDRSVKHSPAASSHRSPLTLRPRRLALRHSYRCVLRPSPSPPSPPSEPPPSAPISLDVGCWIEPAREGRRGRLAFPHPMIKAVQLTLATRCPSFPPRLLLSPGSPPSPSPLTLPTLFPPCTAHTLIEPWRPPINTLWLSLTSLCAPLIYSTRPATQLSLARPPSRVSPPRSIDLPCARPRTPTNRTLGAAQTVPDLDDGLGPRRQDV